MVKIRCIWIFEEILPGNRYHHHHTLTASIFGGIIKNMKTSWISADEFGYRRNVCLS